MLGGLCSLVLSGVMIWYTALKVLTIVYREKTTTNHERGSTNFELLGNQSLSLDNAGVLFYLGINGQDSHERYSVEEMNRYINIVASEVNFDYHDPY